MNSKFFLMTVLCLFPVIVLSVEVTEITIDSSTCWLKERGAAVKHDAISINGVRNESGCSAFMSKTEVAEKFSFCTYSGFEIAGGKKADYYACSISDEGKNFMFRAYMHEVGQENQPDLICRFMCYRI